MSSKNKILLAIFFANALCASDDTNGVVLEQIEVTSEYENEVPSIAKTKKTAKELSKQQASDVRDIVRYETGISVVEKGRMGTSGFSMRGVDENRVAIQIDGLAQAETLSSQGFKELFEGYGNFNNTRNSTEIENISIVQINKGADSLTAGSGALGGAVIYKTKDARDFLIDKDYYLGYKSGYNTADNQNMNSATAAFRLGMFDLLAIRTLRRGHELENYGYKTYDESVKGKKREKTDPYTRKQYSSLVKLGFNPTDEHRITFVSDRQTATNKGLDMSYTLQPYVTGTGWADEVDLRHTNDSVKRQNFQISYDNYQETPLWDFFNITYSNQKIKTRARTDDYCDGGGKCEGVKNNAGLRVKDGKIVDKDGNDPELEVGNIKTEYGEFETILLKNGANGESTRYFKAVKPSDFWFDCSIFDCDKPINGFNGYASGDTLPTNKTFILDESYTDPQTGKLYKRVGSAHYLDFVLMPNSPGYIQNLWKERDLNTDTKQINFDFEKNFDLLKTNHDIKYGGIYSKTHKSMVNRTGYYSWQKKWWFNYYDAVLGEENKFADSTYRVDPENSFLIPIKTDNRSLYISDDFRINDSVSLNFGYRYDNISYKSLYEYGKDPNIPKGLVMNSFVPLPPPPQRCVTSPYTGTTTCYPDERPAQKEARELKNYLDNINALGSTKKYKANSYSLGTELDPFKFLKFQYKYAKAFRAPTADEVYFTFLHPDFTILPGGNLRPEIAKTSELAVTFHDDAYGFVTISHFRTNYKNFIDLKYMGIYNPPNAAGGQTQARGYDMYRNVNRQNAVVKGAEIQAKVKLDELSPYLKGFGLSYKYTKQQGRIRTEEKGIVPMNAIQPKTAVYGLEYVNKWGGFNVYYTRVAAKRASDTYNMYDDHIKFPTPIKWRSDRYSVVDFTAFVTPIKNLVLRAGVYNLTDKKYITWEQARSIRLFGTSNMIDQETGLGINRFYSAGRNYRFTFEYSF
ncbi:TonB-dependent receptor [Campylobacter sp. faydin G-140]|uniref:TonB-dependent receptor domain-containing protein n=1 Tax=Campylobacter anatolicus TaxID=2829105 RepID=UPI001B98E0B5|nr:TonB-dependent receptor [Campylobacter anatolicus]MBR8462688.1 TonB-dependent receptor [Campylobacter anatolicus]MBR8466049.1 TonB-dependent receptor [Campylobacter anatolicus]